MDVKGMRGVVYLLAVLCLMLLQSNRVQAQESYPPLINASLDTLTAGLESGRFSSVDLVNAYIARISEVKDTLNAVAELNPDALEIASQLDDERKNGTIRGPLHGLPILLKNNIGTDDRMNTTSGSWGLLGAKVPRDSTVVAKLRVAGAIILGKANLSQWSNFRSTNSNSGWSAVGGQVLGAYTPQQDPSGSSSGSGVASSVGLAFASIGTETDGSLIAPSSQNNLVGIKPTVGLTSRSMIITLSEHQDSVGPMTRTVKDAAYLLQAMAGVDEFDNYTSAIPANGKLPDYVAACKLSALTGARIGIPRNVLDLLTNPRFAPQISAFGGAVEIMKSAGATIVDNADFPAAFEFLTSKTPDEVVNADFIVSLAKYLGSLKSNPNNLYSLADVRNFTQSFPLEEYPDRNTGVWDEVLDIQGYNNTDPRFWAAYQQNLQFGGEGGLLGALEKHNLDAVILPSNMAFRFAAIVGAPIVTVPLGVYPPDAPVIANHRGNLVSLGPNVPFGLSFLGGKWTEAKLIGLAYAFEQRTMVRDHVQPFVAPSTELKDVIKA